MRSVHVLAAVVALVAGLAGCGAAPGEVSRAPVVLVGSDDRVGSEELARSEQLTGSEKPTRADELVGSEKRVGSEPLDGSEKLDARHERSGAELRPVQFFGDGGLIGPAPSMPDAGVAPTPDPFGLDAGTSQPTPSPSLGRDGGFLL